MVIPQPHRHTQRPGRFSVPPHGTIQLDTPEWTRVINLAQGCLPRHSLESSATLPATLSISLKPTLAPQAYTLSITRSGIRLQAATEQGAFYGLATLRQLIRTAPASGLACHRILDAPDIPTRGAYLDITRGRVPTMDSLKQTIRTLALHKINQVQLYIEHVFTFANHPAIGKRCSPLTPADIRELDAWSKLHFVDLVPSLASFGHMAPILKLKPYQHMAEDLGRGVYEDPEASHAPYRKGWTLSPAVPDSYTFINSLYDDFLPHFTSDKLNVCCDETYDLGHGQSYKLCKKKGRGRVYMDHVLKLRRAAKRHGKSIMFWSDVIQRYPNELERVPKDVTVLDWGYEHNTPYTRIDNYLQRDLATYGCPGTSSWAALFPRIHEAQANIQGYARAVKRSKGDGILITDWGDGGHYNFTEYSWHGLLAGADYAWNTAPTKPFDTRFCHQTIGTKSAGFRRALQTLGDLTHTQFGPYYQSVWKHIFFESPSHKLFQDPQDHAWLSRKGEISKKKIRINQHFAEQTHAKLDDVRAAFTQASKQADDPMGLLPYWIFAVDTLRYASTKLSEFAGGAHVPRRKRVALSHSLEGLSEEFESLWMARNRRSQIRLTLKRFRDQARHLKG